MADPVTIRAVAGKADRERFIALGYTINASDPNWIPPLRDEVRGLLTPGKNPWFEHAEAGFFLAERGGKVVGRISAQIERLPMVGVAAGTGNWGMLEAEDGAIAAALIAAAEDWLRGKGMTRALGPLSLSIWDEPGLLIQGHDHPPTVMMGHNSAAYEAWVEAAGYAKVRDLLTYEVDITQKFPPLVGRIVESGERNPRIRVRKVDKTKFDQEAALILGILNDAWSDNWGFVPLTASEIAYVGKKLKPIVYEDLVLVAEVEGEAVAFMITLPDLNELTGDLDGKLFPFGFIKLLWRLRNPKVRTVRVPLMGVVRRLQASRLASQLAFMMIEQIRRTAYEQYGATRSEIGWILENNQGMRSIAEMIDSRNNKVYRLYEKAL